ncbi:PfkB family carbohydrate kinase [Arthrobacter sp. GMC3]|uniref:PfkB family carbohydrate kinase n=1 Tax=Arthrobacter sp. GMC3 TaxID=2058894 RepID=UPI000CE3055D|nr:PfkB family carbohydrate kinase [Arthrobacter sp. GMC3]
MAGKARPETTVEGKILVVGETLVDILHRADGTIEEKPGGSCANVALTLGRLNRTPRLLTVLGEDSHGHTARAWLEKSAVWVQAQQAARTSTATARLNADGAASYEFDIEWNLTIEQADPIDALHIGSIAATLEPGAGAVSDLVDQHRGRALVSYDPNIRASLVGNPARTRQRVLSLIGRVDVVKASDEDIAWLHPGEAVDDVLQQWLEMGVVLAVVTAGAAGAIAVTKCSRASVEAVPVTVEDTVGAGDTFMGTLIDGLIAGGVFGRGARQAIATMGPLQLSSLLERCARSAAITVSRPGADPPTREELAQEGTSI